MLKRLIKGVLIILLSNILLISCSNRDSDSTGPENHSPEITITTENNNLNFFESDEIVVNAKFSDPNGIEDVEKVVFYLNGVSEEYFKNSFTEVNDSSAVVSYKIPSSLNLQDYAVSAKIFDFSAREDRSRTLNLKIVQGSDFESFIISKTGYKSISDLISEYGTYFIESDIKFDFSKTTHGDLELWNGFSVANLNSNDQGDDLADYYRPLGSSAAVATINQYLCASAKTTAPELQFYTAAGVTPLSVKINTSAHTGEIINNGGEDFLAFSNLPAQADSLYVLFSSFDKNSNKIGEKGFLLADFTFAESYKNYVVDVWTEIDLSDLGTRVKSIKLEVISSRDTSDNAKGALNFFVLDDLKVENVD